MKRKALIYNPRFFGVRIPFNEASSSSAFSSSPSQNLATFKVNQSQARPCRATTTTAEVLLPPSLPPMPHLLTSFARAPAVSSAKGEKDDGKDPSPFSSSSSAHTHLPLSLSVLLLLPLWHSHESRVDKRRSSADRDSTDASSSSSSFGRGGVG